MYGACSRYGGQKRCIQSLLGRLDGKGPFGRTTVDGRIILKYIFKKWDGETCVYSSGSGKGQAVGICESGYEHSASVKCGEILD